MHPAQITAIWRPSIHFVCHIFFPILHRCTTKTTTTTTAAATNRVENKQRLKLPLPVLLALKQFAQRMEAIAVLHIARRRTATVAERAVAELGCRHPVADIGCASAIHHIPLQKEFNQRRKPSTKASCQP